jgi:subtilisin family serine protease
MVMRSVAAVGNESDGAADLPRHRTGVIGVTAVDRRNPTPTPIGRRCDFAAPGVRIWTPGRTPAGSYHTGTSFAVPFVVAAVAARLAGGAAVDAQRVSDSLARTVIDLGERGTDTVFGRGLIQSENPCGAPTQ